MHAIKILHNVLICAALLLIAWSTQAFMPSRDKVVFVREYREYGWRYYGADSVKLVRPLQVLTGLYKIYYEIDASKIIIRKRAYGRNEVQKILVNQVFSKADSRLVTQYLSASQPAQIAQRCEEHPRDDGFHLDVTLVKAGKSTKFDWSGSHEPILLDLLTIVNKLAPQKYKFYELGQQERFKKSLLFISDNP
jgi:hypothetical protein